MKDANFNATKDREICVIFSAGLMRLIITGVTLSNSSIPYDARALGTAQQRVPNRASDADAAGLANYKTPAFPRCSEGHFQFSLATPQGAPATAV
jgi:hypothetical protein